MSQVNTELSRSSTGQISLNETEVRLMVPKRTGTISMGDLRGKRDVVGPIMAWGNNSDGQLGDNTITNKSSPVSTVGGITNWTMLSIYNHAIALRLDGTIWTWGLNNAGQLGNNPGGSHRSSPAQVVGGFSDWVKVSSGGTNSAAIRSNGTLWTWGSAINGVLGNNTSVSRSSPVQVLGGFTDWVDVSVGSFFMIGLRSNGTIWSWGANFSGQLATGDIIVRSSPVQIVGGITNWKSVSASPGGTGTVAIRADGTAWWWGIGQFNGSNVAYNSSLSPVLVAGGFTDWIKLSAGNNYVVGLRSNGTVWSWGNNTQGRLGDGTVTNRISPVQVVGGFTDCVDCDAGEFNSALVRSNGTIWSWGVGVDGGLGDNTLTSKSSPVQVVGGITNWTQISSGRRRMFAIKKS